MYPHLKGQVSFYPDTNRALGVFDLVTSVQSSHQYSDISAFAREVASLLKPGGFFCLADQRDTDQVELLGE